MTPELRDFILNANPDHDWDDTYERYAFDGDAINDDNVWIDEKRPDGFKLRYCFKIQDRYLWVWRGVNFQLDEEIWSRTYWLDARPDAPGKRRDVISIDFESMTKSSLLINTFRGLFDSLKRAIALNRVSYSTPEAYYLVQLVYQNS